MSLFVSCMSANYVLCQGLLTHRSALIDDFGHAILGISTFKRKTCLGTFISVREEATGIRIEASGIHRRPGRCLCTDEKSQNIAFGHLVLVGTVFVSQ